MLTQNGSLGLIGRPPSWIFITKNLTNSKPAETTGSLHVVCFIPLRGKTFFVLSSLYETLWVISCREKPNVSRPGCATSHLHPATTKLVSMATSPGGSKRNNFRFIIYNHSSTNPENLAKILRLFVRAESSIKRNKSKTYSPPWFIFQQPGGLNEYHQVVVGRRIAGGWQLVRAHTKYTERTGQQRMICRH